MAAAVETSSNKFTEDKESLVLEQIDSVTVKLDSDLRQLFRKLYKLSEIQKVPFNEVCQMGLYRKDKNVDKKVYWSKWKEVVDTQKEWVETLQLLKATYNEIVSLAKNVEETVGDGIITDLDFNKIVKTWYPNDKHDDYWKFYAKIEANFKANISNFEKNCPYEYPEASTAQSSDQAKTTYASVVVSKKV